jgi:hypothetical protein
MQFEYLATSNRAPSVVLDAESSWYSPPSSPALAAARPSACAHPLAPAPRAGVPRVQVPGSAGEDGGVSNSVVDLFRIAFTHRSAKSSDGGSRATEVRSPQTPFW